MWAAVIFIVIMGGAFYLSLKVMRHIESNREQRSSPQPDRQRQTSIAAFKMEAPRLLQIIEESVQIINKTKNPQTALHHFDDIQRNTERLFKILPEGQKVSYEINGKTISGQQDMHIIDEEKAKWMAENVKGGVGPPELIAIVRAGNAERIKEKDIPITGVSEESKNKARQIMMDNAAQGQNPKQISSKVASALEPFGWEDFDKWVKIFREAGEWPPLWEDIADYYTAVEQEPVDELLYRLKKDGLMRLVEIKGLVLKKTITKDEMLAKVSAVITEDDRADVLQTVWPDGEKALHKAKSTLLAHTMSDTIEDKLNDWRKWDVKTIEIMPAPDCCSWCAKYNGKKYKVATLKQNNIPPYHPGCRCEVLPADK